MLRSDNSIRFTACEIEHHQRLGIDLQDVKTSEDFGYAVAPWLEALDQVRPDLFEKLAQIMAKAKGAKLPPRLSVVPSSGSAD